ncbi:hypothetical protein H9L39_14845 [Fusarium oxysporum f. sp. albedinis]|nr:hypothetical protein H9L39_14845 [Fusarium oxysporum f. sp. albedinis]
MVLRFLQTIPSLGGIYHTNTNSYQTIPITGADVQGLEVKVSGNVNSTYTLSFAGGYGGADSLIRDFEFWNFTYTMPSDFQGVPSVELDFKLI